MYSYLVSALIGIGLGVMFGAGTMVDNFKKGIVLFLLGVCLTMGGVVMFGYVVADKIQEDLAEQGVIIEDQGDYWLVVEQ